jgi:hypothetical protein
VASLLHAQTASTCPQRRLIVNVREASGKFVPDLPSSAFVVRTHGESVSIKQVSGEPTRHRIVLLLDASASMTGTGNTWEVTRLIARNFLAAAGSTHGVAMVVFGGSVQQTFDFTHSAAEILQWFQQHEDPQTLVPKGARGTALLDTILYGVDLLGTPMPGDAIYAITDGGDNQSGHRQGEVEDVLRARGIRFFSLFADARPSTYGMEPNGPTLPKDLALATGGATQEIAATLTGNYDLSPKSRQHISDQLAYLYGLMSRFYQLNVELPSRFDPKQKLAIKIVDEHGAERKNLRIWYPNYLAPCSTSP